MTTIVHYEVPIGADPRTEMRRAQIEKFRRVEFDEVERACHPTFMILPGIIAFSRHTIPKRTSSPEIEVGLLRLLVLNS
jgi:hypothetical protein